MYFQLYESGPIHILAGNGVNVPRFVSGLVNLNNKFSCPGPSTPPPSLSHAYFSSTWFPRFISSRGTSFDLQDFKF